jgi:isopentenyl phosphate kinase
MVAVPMTADRRREIVREELEEKFEEELGGYNDARMSELNLEKLKTEDRVACRQLEIEMLREVIGSGQDVTGGVRTRVREIEVERDCYRVRVEALKALIAKVGGEMEERAAKNYK